MNERKIFDYARETDTVLIINGSEGSVDKNFFYLSGIEGGVFEGSALVATPDSIKIITSQLEEEEARSSGHEVVIFKTRVEFENLLKSSLKDADTVGLNYDAFMLSVCALRTVSYILLCFSSAFPKITVLVTSEQYLL